MSVLAYVFYAAGYSLQGLLIWRAVRSHLWRFYPFFLGYFMYTFFSGSAQLLLASFRYSGYEQAYWSTEVIASVLRLAVGWELYRHLFPRNSVVRSIAGVVLSGALVVLALALWMIGTSTGIFPAVDFMRKLAFSAALWVVLVMGLARLYSIPMGRNIGGMVIGFMIFNSSEIANFAAIELSLRFEPIWRFVHPFSYLCMLAVWVWAFWSYAPSPELDLTEAADASQQLSRLRVQSAALHDAAWKVIKP